MRVKSEDEIEDMIESNRKNRYDNTTMEDPDEFTRKDLMLFFNKKGEERDFEELPANVRKRFGDSPDYYIYVQQRMLGRFERYLTMGTYKEDIDFLEDAEREIEKHQREAIANDNRDLIPLGNNQRSLWGYDGYGDGWDGHFSVSYNGYKKEVLQDKPIYSMVKSREKDTFISEWYNAKEIGITRELYLELVAIVKKKAEEHHEVGGLLKIKKTKDGYLMYDYCLLKQTAGGASFEVDNDALAEWMGQHMFDADFDEWKGWWHSHHNLGLFWSGTDDDMFKQFIGSKNDFKEVIGIVFTSNGDFRTRYDVKTPMGCITLDDINCHIGTKEENNKGKKFWKYHYDQIQERVSKAVVDNVDRLPPVVYKVSPEFATKDDKDNATILYGHCTGKIEAEKNTPNCKCEYCQFYLGPSNDTTDTIVLPGGFWKKQQNGNWSWTDRKDKRPSYFG